MAHATWKRAIALGLLIPRGRCAPRAGTDARRIYDWSEVQAYYDAGHSYRQCQQKFGFCAGSWDKARKRGDMKVRPFAMPLEELMRRGKSRYNVKMRLLRSGLLKDECSACGLTHWRGKRLSLHIDHINGVKNDHRLENLRMLCPNCHSQTETYGGRNAKKGRRSLQDDGSVV
jgi:5-methylcytosine-specific restriction endonuclease McrA